MQFVASAALVGAFLLLGGAQSFSCSRLKVQARPTTLRKQRATPLRLSAAAAAAGREEMNPEDVAKFPLPGTASPISLSFSPDDNILSYLHAEGGQLTRQVRE